jgi:dTDP-4-dehydrorhamnose 3,5-epimerase
VIFAKGNVQGAYVVDLERREDERGYFARLWCDEEFSGQGLAGRVRQINTGYSTHAGTLRGMHLQRSPYEEAKVVRCVRGAVFDVAVDVRPGSPTHKQWVGVELTADNGRMLYVPAGCAHGYLTLVDSTELMYLTSAPYAPNSAVGVRYNDPAFAISWPAEIRVVSDADRGWPNYEN